MRLNHRTRKLLVIWMVIGERTTKWLEIICTPTHCMMTKRILQQVGRRGQYWSDQKTNDSPVGNGCSSVGQRRLFCLTWLIPTSWMVSLRGRMKQLLKKKSNEWIFNTQESAQAWRITEPFDSSFPHAASSITKCGSKRVLKIYEKDTGSTSMSEQTAAAVVAFPPAVRCLLVNLCLVPRLKTTRPNQKHCYTSLWCVCLSVDVHATNQRGLI